mmetsp:Transcript_30240/g.59385  ORF Transcript_30240/g.59385 Transcript_30240/m.59385 type:complete len:109 (+) Transcript_30240:510-836(+)
MKRRMVRIPRGRQTKRKTQMAGRHEVMTVVRIPDASETGRQHPLFAFTNFGVSDWPRRYKKRRQCLEGEGRMNGKAVRVGPHSRHVSVTARNKKGWKEAKALTKQNEK